MHRLSFLIFFLFSGISFLQSFGQSLSGIVTDENGEPLPEVYIIRKNSVDHCHSDNFGEFEIKNLSYPDTLICTHIGYEKAIIPLDEALSNQQLKVKLKRKYLDLNEVLISGNLKSLNIKADIDITTNPVNSSQEILRTVPGLFIGQHAGGGKAEQIFLRGFDIDHGTDINISVDGLPVNMVSHAHGQGYADLHFLIPEIIEKIDYGKGVYYADKGNFTTSGYVEFKTKEKLSESEASIEYGDFNTLRTSTLLNVLNTNTQSAYFAGEFLLTDGAFESSQNFNRINLFAKYNVNINNYDKLTISTSYFTSKWNASGQIPQRAVDANKINRFGAIDDTEGGNTSRTNVNLNYFKYINKQTFVKNKVFYTKYDFELYSNFTFFLNDPVNGDQIKQKENRTIIGAESELTRLINTNIAEIKIKPAIGFRHDIIKDNELSHTKDRKITIDQINLGDIDETNIYGYIDIDFDFGKWLINPAIRVDYFKFNYQDMLSAEYEVMSNDKLVVSPKLNILYNQSQNLQLYLKSGLGFHSNDTRVVIAENSKEILPIAYGTDLGAILKPFNRLIINGALWYLYLQDELVYVGDEGIVEPSGETQRIGFDFGVRYQLTNNIFINNDLSYSYAKSLSEPEGQNYIPLAPDLINTGGISISNLYRFSGGIQYRYISDRAANEDNSIIAKGYVITDLNVTYQIKNIEAGFIVENLFNVEWNETQFATETRLQNEEVGVEEIHFIPGSPLFLKFKIGIKF